MYSSVQSKDGNFHISFFRSLVLHAFPICLFLLINPGPLSSSLNRAHTTAILDQLLLLAGDKVVVLLYTVSWQAYELLSQRHHLDRKSCTPKVGVVTRPGAY